MKNPVESIVFHQDGRMPSIGATVKMKVETDNEIREATGTVESHAGERFTVRLDQPLEYRSGQNVSIIPEPEPDPEIETLARELRLPSHYQIGERVFVNGLGYVNIVGIHFTEKKVRYDVLDAAEGAEVARDIDSADVEPHAPPEATLA